MRIGQGFDVHRLVEGRPLIIGGVEIDYPLGLLGHSDADVLLHAIVDACLGAAGMGDIGKHFPPSDSRFEGKDSRFFVQRTARLLKDRQLQVSNLDCTIIAEKPRMADYLLAMRKCIAKDMGVNSNCINVKATTTEGLGYCGRGEGIAAQAVVLLTDADQAGAR